LRRSPEGFAARREAAAPDVRLTAAAGTVVVLNAHLWHAGLAYAADDAPTYYYDSPPAYAQPAPAAPPATYRYYCPNGGYWPDVKSCSQGWLRVLPN